MSMRFHTIKLYTDFSYAGAPVGFNTATTGIVIPTVDISNFDRFSILFQNSGTTIIVRNVIVQAAYDPTPSQSDVADNFVQIPTATLPQPCAIGALSQVLIAPVTNAYKYLRVLASTDASTTAPLLTVTIGGFLRS